MSRSLRSRPLTLYDSSGSGPSSAVPLVQNSASSRDSNYLAHQQQQQQQQQQPHSAATPSSGGSTSAKARLKKASQVGSNLKKRLSTRYGTSDDNKSPLPSSSLGGASSPPPAVPPIPSHQQQPALPSLGSGLQDYIFDEEEDEHDGHDGHAHPPRSHQQQYEEYPAAAAAAEMSAVPIPRRRPVPMHDSLGVPSAAQMSTTGAPSAASSTSSRRPTLAWEGSSLRSTLEQAHSQGLGDVIDLDFLRKQHEQFNPTDYLRLHMVDGRASQAFSSTLLAAKDASRTDVRSQVFDHYADFISISTQVGALENEMIELKSLLGQWRSMPRVLEREDESGRIGAASNSILATTNEATRRNSLLSLQQVYRAQLTSLWEGIANSQKFIPYKPGRHLIAEAPDFVELNAATYRPAKNVALFLLDDLLLVASRKKGKMSTKVSLEAERCFALGDIVVVDLKDSAVNTPVSASGPPATPGSVTDLTSPSSSSSTQQSVSNSIKIKRGKETFVYRAERPESKKALLAAFRRVAEDLANKRKKQGTGTGMLDVANPSGVDNRRMSVYAGMSEGGSAMSKAAGRGGGGGGGVGDDLNPAAADDDDSSTQGVMKLATERVREERRDPHRWTNDWSDSLAVDIALRRWSEAVEKVLKGKAVLSTYSTSDPAHAMITTHLARHTSSLVSALLVGMQSSTLRKTTLVQLATHLSSLGYSSIARQTFLSSRSDLVRRRKRAIKFEGDTELYVSELSMVVFGMIRNTSEWFMASWKEVGMASGFVKWALSEVHAFAMGFKRQVFGDGGGGGGGGNDAVRGAATGSSAGSASSSMDEGVVRRARAVAMESAKQLKDVGLDFGFVLNELLKSPKERQREREAVDAMPVTRPLNTARPAVARSVSASSAASGGGGGGGVSSRIAAFEGGGGGGGGDVNVSASSSSPPRRRRGSSSSSSSTTTTSSSSIGGARRPPLRSASNSDYPLPNTTLGGTASSRPPLPSMPASYTGSGSGTGSNSTSPTTKTSFLAPSSFPPPAPPTIPSLTLTLADEASGISHRISSADLPGVSAQEIRRRSRVER